MTGPWSSRSQVIDNTGQTVTLLCTAHRDELAVERFLTQAIRCHGVPATIPLDGGEAYASASQRDREAHGPAIIRRVTYLTVVVEQDHRAVTRRSRPALGFTSVEAAPCPLAGIELMQMSRKANGSAAPTRCSPRPNSVTPWPHHP